MGNTSNSLSQSRFEISQQNERLKRLCLQAQKFSKQKGLDHQNSAMVRCIFVHKRQEHLIQVIRKIQDPKRMDDFLDQAFDANIQILDSFYEHIVKKSLQNQHSQVILTPFDRQIGLCGSSGLFREQQLQPISDKYVQIIDLSKDTKTISNYQKYKQIGLESLRKKEVCFVMLAGGKNMRYDLKEPKHCDTFEQLPSKSSLIIILLKKLQALGRLIETVLHIYLMVDSQATKNKIKELKGKKMTDAQFIEIDFIIQVNYGCLDLEGRLVINDDDQIYFHPNGNGDLWANFEGKNMGKLGFSNYKYIQVFGVSNFMEHCFDCYMIGKLVVQKRPWATLCSEYKEEIDVNTPFIYVDKDKKIRMTDPEEIRQEKVIHEHIGSEWKKAFLNNSIFSIQYIKYAVNHQKWIQFRKYHCKHKQVNNQQPLSKYKELYTFQKQYTDIFALSDLYKETVKNRKFNQQIQYNGVILLMNRAQYYSPFYTKEDKVKGIVQLSELYKKWLKIQEDDQYNTPRRGQKKRRFKRQDQKSPDKGLDNICQIDPYISLQGQNLQDTIQQLKQIRKQNKLLYPLYIREQFEEESAEYKSTENTKTKFQELNKILKNNVSN